MLQWLLLQHLGQLLQSNAHVAGQGGLNILLIAKLNYTFYGGTHGSDRIKTMAYDFDSLHTKIDNDATEHKLDPFEALEIWQLGLELWEKRRHILLFGSIKDKNNEINNSL